MNIIKLVCLGGRWRGSFALEFFYELDINKTKMCWILFLSYLMALLDDSFKKVMNLNLNWSYKKRKIGYTHAHRGMPCEPEGRGRHADLIAQWRTKPTPEAQNRCFSVLKGVTLCWCSDLVSKPSELWNDKYTLSVLYFVTEVLEMRKVSEKTSQSKTELWQKFVGTIGIFLWSRYWDEC